MLDGERSHLILAYTSAADQPDRCHVRAFHYETNSREEIHRFHR